MIDWLIDLADSNQRKFRVLTTPRCAGGKVLVKRLWTNVRRKTLCFDFETWSRTVTLHNAPSRVLNHGQRLVLVSLTINFVTYLLLTVTNVMAGISRLDMPAHKMFVSDLRNAVPVFSSDSCVNDIKSWRTDSTGDTTFSIVWIQGNVAASIVGVVHDHLRDRCQLRLSSIAPTAYS